MTVKELEGLQQGIALLADLTEWAVHVPTPGTKGNPPAAPPLLLGQLRGSLQAGLQGGALGVLQNRPKQLLLWLLEAEHKVCELASHVSLCLLALAKFSGKLGMAAGIGQP